MSTVLRNIFTPVLSLVVAVGVLMPIGGTSAAAAVVARAVSVSTPYPVREVAFTVSGKLPTKIVRPVLLQRRSGSKWATVASGKTSKSGRYTFEVSTSLSKISLRVVAKRIRIGKRIYSARVTKVRTMRTLAVTPATPIRDERFTVADAIWSGSKVARPVVLQRRSGKKWVTVASGKTSKSGRFELATSTGASSAKLRVVAKKVRVKGKTHRKVVTKTATVETASQAGTLSVPTTGVVDSGTVAALSFSPARAGRAVSVEMLVGGTWQQVGVGVMDVAGDASVTFAPTIEGTVSLRGVAAAFNGAVAVTTPIVNMDVGSGERRPAIAVGALSGSVVDGDFQGALTASGGTGPYRWAATGLPAGVTLDPDTGVLSGTPTTAGTYTVTFTVTDATGATGTTAAEIVVRPLVSVDTTTLPGGVVATSYSFALTAAGGTAPFTWAASGLPAWLSVDAAGLLSGTPTATGTSAFTVTVTDATGKYASAQLSVAVIPAVSISTASLPSGVVGSSYSATLTAADGTPPYHWSATGLPAGLSVGSTTGAVTGIPTTAGTSSVQVSVSDDNGKTAVADLSIVVAAGAAAPSITTTSLPAGVVGTAYSTSLAASSGLAPYSWSQTGLPNGLSLDSATGVISGTPTATGSSSVSIAVTDANSSTASKTLTLAVGAAVSITTTSLPDAVVGGVYSTTLVGAGGTAPRSWSATGLPAGLTLASATGKITGTAMVAETASVELTITDAKGKTATATLALRVETEVLLSPTSLPDGSVGVAYAQTATATGGTGPYTWSASGLPSGLSIDASTGAIAGTPSDPGRARVVVSATDSRGQVGTETIPLEIATTANLLSVGGAHSCVITSGGGVMCWGYNSYGALGNGSTVGSGVPVKVTGLSSGVTALAGGGSHQCALTSAGGVKCWGANTSGQLGDGTTTRRLTPVDVSGLASGVIAVSAGGDSTCAVTTAGALKCWGANSNGQLGNGTTTSASVPTDVTGLSSGVAAASMGDSHACALTDTGTAKCWGANSSGQLGDGTTTVHRTPADVTGLTGGVTSISAAGVSTCAVTSSAGAQCWGGNASGQLGNGTTTNASVPTDVNGLTSGVAMIDTYTQFSCALTTSGAVKCWGANSNGELGNGTTDASLTPVDASGLSSGITQLGLGYYGACAADNTGTVKCWGRNNYGQVGDGVGQAIATPVVSALGADVATLVAGANNTCMITDVGAVRCLGGGSSGQLGNGTTPFWSDVLVDVTGLGSGQTAVSAGPDFACAVTVTGGVKCWGANSVGQLGDDTTSARSTPVDVTGLTSGVVAISTRFRHTCVVTSTGGVKCWGANNYGQLGDGTKVNSRVPVDVSGLAGPVSAVATGVGHSCALMATGEVQCWGFNSSGQLGNASTTDSLTPVNATGLTGVASLIAGDTHTCAVTSAGQAKCWGAGGSGQLGNGSTANRTQPTDVTGMTSGVKSIAAGGLSTCAVTLVGRVKCWGYNDIGQLGDGTFTTRMTPVNVAGLASGVDAVFLGGSHACALTTAKDARCWGSNSAAEAGASRFVVVTPQPVVGMS